MEAAIETCAAPQMNRRTRAKAATRQKVLDAGKALFDTVGYEAATIRAIAKACGMSTGAVFANFEDKADLYHALFQHYPVTPEGGRRLLAAMKAALSEIDARLSVIDRAADDDVWLALQGLSDEGHMAVAMASIKPEAA